MQNIYILLRAYLQNKVYAEKSIFYPSCSPLPHR